MITDAQTNKVFLSSLLKSDYPELTLRLKQAFTNHQVKFDFLTNTKEIWCRDYMPIQVSQDRYVQFTFRPNYLWDDPVERKYITDPSRVWNKLGMEPNLSDLIVDGGNIVKASDKVVMTSKIFEENPQFTETQIKDHISELLEIERVIIVPPQPGDFTGHADGIVRFINDDTVLINDNSESEDQKFAEHLKQSLQKEGLKVIEIPTSVYRNTKDKDASGIYVNYLQVEGVVFVPVYKRRDDDQVLKLFEDLFEARDIVPILCDDIAKEGGVLNCVSWSITSCY